MKKKRLKQIKKLQKRKHKITLDELFADYTGNYKPVEINWGKPVGREIW
ncbi:AbrB/MazE/SpoVT family DNA-binding domain-containing protein [Phascolarctobacterium sp.]